VRWMDIRSAALVVALLGGVAAAGEPTGPAPVPASKKAPLLFTLDGPPAPFAARLAEADAVLRKARGRRAVAIVSADGTVAGDVSLLNRRMAQALGRVTGLSKLTIPAGGKPDARSAADWWNGFMRRHESWLGRTVTAKPKLATYLPRDPGQEELDVRDRLWANHVLALQRLGYAVHVLRPAQVAGGQVHDYEMLFCLLAAAHPDPVVEQINLFWHDPDEVEKWRAKMREKHGPDWQPTHKHWTDMWVLSSFDSLRYGPDWDTSSGMLQRIHRVEPWKVLPGKPLDAHKGTLAGPSRWYEITLASPGLPPVGTKLPSYNGIMLGQPFHGAFPYAHHKGKPVVIGTRKGMHIGSDLATDIALACPKHDKDPALPLQWECPSVEPDTYRAMIAILTRYLYFAEIHSPVAITHKGKAPLDSHASLLLTGSKGVRLAVVTNDAAQPRTYDIRLPMGKGDVLWDLLGGKLLEPAKPGRYRITVPAGGFLLLLAGAPAEAKPIIDLERAAATQAAN